MTSSKCDDYSPGDGTRECRHFYREFEDAAGACSLDEHFMCPKWLATRVVEVDGDLVKIRKKVSK